MFFITKFQLPFVEAGGKSIKNVKFTKVPISEEGGHQIRRDTPRENFEKLKKHQLFGRCFHFRGVTKS